MTLEEKVLSMFDPKDFTNFTPDYVTNLIHSTVSDFGEDVANYVKVTLDVAFNAVAGVENNPVYTKIKTLPEYRKEVEDFITAYGIYHCLGSAKETINNAYGQTKINSVKDALNVSYEEARIFLYKDYRKTVFMRSIYHFLHSAHIVELARYYDMLLTESQEKAQTR